MNQFQLPSAINNDEPFPISIWPAVNIVRPAQPLETVRHDILDAFNEVITAPEPQNMLVQHHLQIQSLMSHHFKLWYSFNLRTRILMFFMVEFIFAHTHTLLLRFLRNADNIALGILRNLTRNYKVVNSLLAKLGFDFWFLL